MIEFNDVSFRYHNSANFAVKELSLKILKGDFIGIIGPTGSGKSTLCYFLNSLIPHYFNGNFEGTVIINGKNASTRSVKSMSEIVGFMLQEPAFQIASSYVESEITFGMENFNTPIDEMAQRLVEIIEKLGISHLRYRATSELSEGEKQKVILASILVMNPLIVVLDECSSMIDTTSKKELGKILKTYHQEGKTIILIDHDLDFIAEVTERVILINNGKIIADGPTNEILTNNSLLSENGLVPPTFPSLFNAFYKQSLPVTTIPTSHREAYEIIRSWLE